MKKRSLAREIGAIVLVAQVVCALGLFGAALVHEQRTRQHAFDVRLQGRSDSLLGAIQDAEDPEDNVSVDPAELRLPRTDSWAVYNQGGRLLGSTGGVRGRLLAEQAADGLSHATIDGTSYRVIQQRGLRIIDRAETGGAGRRRPITIVYASPDGDIAHEVFEAASYDLMAIFIAATLTGAIVVMLLRRALLPLSELAAEASKVSFANLHFQAPDRVRQVQELEPLGRVLTEAVASLRHSFEKEQRFFGDAAHELKTAVAVARSSLQLMLLRERTSQGYREGLDRALEDNDRIESLVTQMLRLASVTEADPHKVPSDFSTAVGTTCVQLRSVADMRQVQLHVELESGSLVALSSERAGVLASNLVLNAIQHAPPGSTVRVSVTRRDSQVCLEVCDHGSGIGETALPHIFERFFREDPSRSRATGGTGLGLAICKSIVDAAGGRISVASRRGAGTTFTVVFTHP